jgi:hypothetical protein
VNATEFTPGSEPGSEPVSEPVSAPGSELEPKPEPKWTKLQGDMSNTVAVVLVGGVVSLVLLMLSITVYVS